MALDDWSEEDDWAEVQAEQQELAADRINLLASLHAIIPETGHNGNLVVLAIPADVEGLLARAAQLADAITLAGQRDLAALEQQITALGQSLVAVQEAVATRQDVKRQLLDAAEAIIIPDHALNEEIETFERHKADVTAPLTLGPVTTAELKAAAVDLKGLKSFTLALTDRIRQRLAEHARIRDEGAGITLEGYLPDQQDRLVQKRSNLDAALEDPVSDDRLEAAQIALDALKEAAAEVQQELDSLDGVAGIEALCVEVGIDPAAYPELESNLGGRNAVAALLQAFGPGQLGALCKAYDATALANLVNSAGGAAELKKTCDALGGAAGLKTLTDAGKSGAEIVTICADLGGSFIKELIKDGGTATEIAELHLALGNEAAEVQKLAAASGFDSKPAAFVALFKTGCGGDVATFKTFCTAFASTEEQIHLKGLIDAGGLGDAPDALVHLYVNGGGTDMLKQLGKSFDDDMAQAGLKRALATGGLAGQSGVSGQGDISTDCLLKLLELGGGPKPSGMSTSEDLTRRCDALAGIAAKMDDSAAAGLKTILANGGLGTDPEVLGQLVGIGCEGDGDAFANLAKELAKGGTPARLKDALQKGGLGSVDDAGSATGTVTTCLAKLLNPGSDGDPAELAKLLNALDSTQKLADLKGVIITGELGKHPEILGDLYRNGCLASPEGAADGTGAKEPQVLIDMIGEFRGTDAGKFKELMTTAGFDSWDATNNVSRLGSVMRYGFTPDGGSQDGKKLRQFYDAFKPSSTNDHLADLATTLAALEGAPDWVLETSTAGAPNQPGKGMRNVMFAGARNGNPSDLHSTFFTKLQTYATATSGAVGRLPLDELIQNAASFEHQPVPLGSGSSSVPLSDGSTAHLRLDHVLDRHTRKYQGFQLTKTTLYPRQVTEIQIEEIAASTLDSFATTAFPRQFGTGVTGPDPDRPLAQQPPVSKRDPPQDIHDLRGDYVFYDPVPGTYDDTSGTQAVASKIGFNPDPLNTGPPPEVYVGQLFPRTGPDLITVHKHDMRAMKQVLAV